MKILILSPESLEAAHGGAVHTQEVVRAFADLGHDVFLAAAGGANLPCQFLSCSMRLGPLASTWRAWPYRKRFKNFQPDLIYERQLVGGGLGAYLGKLWQRPVVYEVNSPHRQEYLYRFSWLKPLAPCLLWWEHQQFKQVACVVTTHEKLIPPHYQGPRLVGPWAVRSFKTQPASPLWPELAEKKIILVAGSFQSWHGGQRLQLILEHLKKGPWAVVLLGGGGIRQALVQNLQHLSFPVIDGGVLDPDHMSQAYFQSHVLLAPFDRPLPDYPFYYSPFKILEALACSLPVVTHDYENLKILLDEPWCGVTLSQRATDRAWAEALESILSQDSLDSQKGDNYAQRHSWRQHVSQILEKVCG